MFALSSPPFVRCRNADIIRPCPFLSRLLRDEWREIASAPFDREIEAATIGGCIITIAGLHACVTATVGSMPKR